MRLAQAVAALAPHIPAVKVRNMERGQYAGRVRIGVGKHEPIHKTPAHALAHLADLALMGPDSDGVRERVGWRGPMPTKGLAAWEQSALQWLMLGDV